MILDLPYPAKLLWPNGRTRSPFAKSRETKKHKAWAITAAYGERANAPVGDRLRLIATFHCKPRGPLPDADNAAASTKSYQDGIASALGVAPLRPARGALRRARQGWQGHHRGGGRMTTPRIQQYAAEAAQRHGVTADAVLGRDKHAAPCAARREVMCRLRADGFRTTQIGRWMQRDHSTVSVATRGDC